MINNIHPNSIDKKINFKTNFSFLNDGFWTKSKKETIKFIQKNNALETLVNIGNIVEQYNSPSILLQEIMVTVHMDYNKQEKLHLFSINDILGKIKYLKKKYNINKKQIKRLFLHIWNEF